jgi:hypothetical protein
LPKTNKQTKKKKKKKKDHIQIYIDIFTQISICNCNIDLVYQIQNFQCGRYLVEFGFTSCMFKICNIAILWKFRYDKGLPWGFGFEWVLCTVLLACRKQLNGGSIRWNRRIEGPVSQQVWHDRYPSLFNGPHAPKIGLNFTDLYWQRRRLCIGKIKWKGIYQ